MPLVNAAKNEVNVKIVLYGAPGAGKGATLEAAYRALKPEVRGKMKSMSLRDDRMLFFDFLPGIRNSDGLEVRAHLYTLQGQVSGAGSWKNVMKGCDGIIFVADSATEKEEENIRAR